MTTVCNLLSYWWLSIWSTDYYSADTWFYLKYYTIISSFIAVFMFIYQFAWVSGSYYSSKKLHFQLLNKIIATSVSFFDKTPTGRLINRFTEDVRIIDFDLYSSFSRAENYIFSFLGTVILIVILVPFLLIVFVPAALFYCFLKIYFTRTQLEAQRIVKNSKKIFFYSKKISKLTW